ncbi:hypothetical protein V1503_24745 [Bacillus sp. SCS-151]|uniref:hypothetical protein n=1 Tax=Nanhaiella sioensis TaxID=3115293 RepID=UPI00397B8C08
MGKTKMNQQTLIEQVTKISTEMAVKAAMEYMEEQKKKEEKEKYDKRLRNTKILIKNYRNFVLHTKDIQDDIDQLNDNLLIDDLHGADELAVESIKRSKQRTLAMIKFINQMFVLYKNRCEDSDKPEDMRRYETVFYMYISDDKKTVNQIAKENCIDNRTVYKDINNACKELSSLMFGVDGIRFVL